MNHVRFFVVAITFNVALSTDIHDIITRTIPGPAKSALKFRMNQNFLNELTAVFVNVSELIATKVKLDDVNDRMGQVQGLRVVQFQKPESTDLHFDPKINGMHAEIRKMAVRLNGRLNVPLYRISSDFSTLLSGITIRGDVTQTKGQNDHLQFILAQCQASIDSSNTDLTNFKGSKLMAFSIKKNLNSLILKVAKDNICTYFKKVLEEDINAEFGKSASLNMLGEEQKKEVGNGTQKQTAQIQKTQGTDSFQATMAEGLDKIRRLMLNLKLEQPPVTTPDYAEYDARGEISYDDRGGTPYNYPPMLEPVRTIDRMVALLISDYVLNSFLYHAYSQGVFHTKISADIFKQHQLAEVVQLLFDVILGEVLPDFEDQYPHHIAGLEFLPRRSPVALFEKNGNVSAECLSTLILSARKNQTGSALVPIMELHLDVIGQFKLNIIRQTFLGNFSFSSFDIRLVSSKLRDFDEQKLQDLKKFLQSLITNLLQSTFSSGLRLPDFKGIHLVNSRMNIYERIWKIETDLKFDYRVIADRVEGMMREHGKLLA